MITFECFSIGFSYILGAGTGWQAQAAEVHGYDVRAIDLSSSNYRKDAVWPITEYDGKTIPYKADTFDIVVTYQEVRAIFLF